MLVFFCSFPFGFSFGSVVMAALFAVVLFRYNIQIEVVGIEREPIVGLNKKLLGQNLV